ncbi:hypothetical protein PVAP13_7KG068099 [Panicum virgatum]|uniref:Uncharacterized protein n=1 Tax=Panicum virgatum TaxID=38727 RepID=A0A8T0QA08_PANVG|nr:hypothetical protein PVAP13_7KG068099 [Panicum virgatum]
MAGLHCGSDTRRDARRLPLAPGHAAPPSPMKPRPNHPPGHPCSISHSSLLAALPHRRPTSNPPHGAPPPPSNPLFCRALRHPNIAGAPRCGKQGAAPPYSLSLTPSRGQLLAGALNPRLTAVIPLK